MIAVNIHPTVEPYQPLRENFHRPWLVVRLLASSQSCIVARFANRRDADDHLRFLQRFIPNAAFEIMFEPPMKDAEIHL
ncbi:hypothetical protein NIES4074_43300 [Cylindrospermum sp. NIES-4074]|jgi:putative acetyltransferase|nr:hypothetical protein NIES4074_43300 [Cylindrospermum sp. NIES-4074]